MGNHTCKQFLKSTPTIALGAACKAELAMEKKSYFSMAMISFYSVHLKPFKEMSSFLLYFSSINPLLLCIDLFRPCQYHNYSYAIALLLSPLETITDPF
jgi:hypothetical protein